MALKCDLDSISPSQPSTSVKGYRVLQESPADKESKTIGRFSTLPAAKQSARNAAKATGCTLNEGACQNAKGVFAVTAESEKGEDQWFWVEEEEVEVVIPLNKKKTIKKQQQGG